MSVENPQIWQRDPRRPWETSRRLRGESPDIIRTVMGDLTFDVERGSTIPPSLETYTHGRTLSMLVQEMLTDPAELKPIRVVDVGTGCGVFPITLVHELRTIASGSVKIDATDISERALVAAEKNMQKNGLSGIIFSEADCLQRREKASADIIFSNPPFLPKDMQEGKTIWTPTQADFYPPVTLIAGETGMEMYHSLFEQAKDVLTSRGIIMVQCQDGDKAYIQSLARQHMGKSVSLEEVAGYQRTAIVVGDAMMAHRIQAQRKKLK